MCYLLQDHFSTAEVWIPGDSEDAKRALQAQPLASLRPLAAALLRGDLNGPDGRAFPGVI